MRYNKKTLAQEFNIDPRTLKKLYKAHETKIGPYIGKAWTPGQVKIWKQLFQEGIYDRGQDAD